MSLPTCLAAPCGSCPYRRDVPSGIWDASEYAKLPGYDGEIADQVAAGAFGLFFCHQQDGNLCAGWVGCHDMAHMLATRLHRVAPEVYHYRSPVPLFTSGREAAQHGLAEINRPGPAARRAIQRLTDRRTEL